MNTESLYDKFLKGKLAVLVDKDNPAEIHNFYELFEDQCFLTPGLWHCSALDYLLNEISGPYHFVDTAQHKLNGAGQKYIVDHCMDICTVQQFLLDNLFEETSETKTDLNDIEYTNVLFGVV